MTRLMRQTGFTLFDLMVTMTIIVVMAAVILPNLKDDAQIRLIAGSRLLSSDLEMAQIMTISNPEQPIVVRFEPSVGRYWLAEADDADTPIKRPGSTGDYFVEFGKGDARSASGVFLGVAGVSNDTIAFSAQGGIEDFTATPEITLLQGTHWIKLSISPMTGTISETAGTS